jgi:3-oxo-Delta1-steroid hydratase/dehydrogenase large subunit
MPAGDSGRRWASRPTRIREDRRFVTGRGRYVADITPPGSLHVGLVTSPYAHARIVSIDPGEALELDGVACVLTGAELAKVTEPLRQYLPLPARTGLPAVQWRPLAVAEARYAGEWVAAVVASSRAVAEDAAELVNVDYEPLDAVLDPQQALSDGSPLVHAALGSNVLAHREFTWGDVAGDFARADSVSRVRVRWNRSSTVPLETFGVVASWDDDARLLDVWASVQMPQFPEQLARALRLAGNQVRVHFDVDVGGSYGVKRGIKHAVLAGHLSMLLRAPVKLIEDRAENMHGGDFHGPDRIFDVELACTADGDFISVKIAVIDDEGAFPGRSPLQLAKPIGAIVGPYRIGSAAYTATAVATNKTGQVAVRGFGQAPTNYAIESAVDAAARSLGMDRLAIRRRNFIKPDEFPYRIPSGTEYDSGDYPAVLDKLVGIAGTPARPGLTALQERRDELRAAGKLAGIGVATCLEPSGGNAIFENVMNPANDKTTFPEGCRLRVDSGGAVTAIVSIASAGQGHETMVATLVAEELGRDPDSIMVVRADSLTGMPSQSPVGSRMTIVLGEAVRGAAAELKLKLRRIGAHVLGVDVDQVSYLDGSVATRSGKSLGWAELADIALRKQHLMPPGEQPGLEVVHVAHTPRSGNLAGPDAVVQIYPCYSFEAHLVLAAVDPETGEVDLDRYFLAHDCGTVINPPSVRGMLFGGTAHGIGVALYEQFAFSADGQPLTQSFMDYLLPSIHEVPQITDTEHCTPSPFTTLGQKGAGEAGYMGAPAAVASAVNDALAARGAGPVRSLPIRPADVWLALGGGPQ